MHLPIDEIIKGKLQALNARHKPRDFYDYFFLLSGRAYPMVREKAQLQNVLALLQTTKLDFRKELREFLPANHSMHLRDFRKILIDKIQDYAGTENKDGR